MPIEDVSLIIDWDTLFSAHVIVLVGDPLTGIFEVRDYIKSKNPDSDVTVVHERTPISLFEKADLIIEVIQKITGTAVERDLIIQKWKGYDVPNNLIPFLIKQKKIELDTKNRIV